MPAARTDTRVKRKCIYVPYFTIHAGIAH
jgi:hypothetical protein